MNPSSTRTEYEKRQLAFYRYIQGLQQQETVEGMGKILFHFLKEWFQFELIWIAQYEAQAHLLSGIQGILPKTTDRGTTFLRRKQTILPGDLFDQVLLTGTLQEIPNLKQEQRVGEWQAIAQSQNIQGCIILPIRYRQASFGVILVGTTLWGGHPRAEEMTVLKLLATTMGAELNRIFGPSPSGPTQSSQPLSLGILGQILEAGTFEARLQLVLEQLHQAVRPARSCLYWFDTEAQACRLHDIYTGPLPKRSSTKVVPKLDLSLQSIASFYQSSLHNQIVAIADMQGLITSNQAPTRLMTMTKSRAWLSAPIFDHGRLIAVLAAESNEPHLWSETDRQFIQILAKLLGQGNQEGMKDPSLAKGDHFSLNGFLGLLKDVYNDTEQWDYTLLQCLEHISIQFSVRWAAIITRDLETEDFRCRAQFYSKKKQQPLPEQLPPLSAVDAKMLLRMTSPIAIQSLAEDLRLLAWHQPLTDRGVKSLVLWKLDQNQKDPTLGSFLMLATDLPRTWISEELEAAHNVTEPLGQALSQRNQWQYETFQVRFMTVLNQGLQAIQLNPSKEALFTIAAQALHTLLEVECLMILRWSPEQPDVTIAALINQSKFQVNEQIPISWQADGFLQRILSQTDKLSPTSLPELFTQSGSFEEIAGENMGWLGGMGRMDLLAVPLKIYPEDPCLGLVLILDSRCQYWTDLTREGIQLLTRELTLSYRSHYVVDRLKQKQATLECLSWYKQRHLESISQLWTEQMSHVQPLPSSSVPMTSGQGGSIQGGSRPRSSYFGTDLYSAFSSLELILKSEVWDLHLDAEQVQVATLLRRALEHIEELTRSRQLWTQVHNLTPSVSLYVPTQKLELMLVELLRAACYRSKAGDRIDIWCRSLPQEWVEISITDNGRLNPRLVQAIQYPPLHIPLSTPILETPPGLHYKVCQSLVERMGGQLAIAQLEDGRAMSRLILPISSIPQQ